MPLSAARLAIDRSRSGVDMFSLLSIVTCTGVCGFGVKGIGEKTHQQQNILCTYYIQRPGVAKVFACYRIDRFHQPLWLRPGGGVHVSEHIYKQTIYVSVCLAG